MLRSLIGRPTRVLMTVDAVGGVWRYALDLAGALAAQGCAIFLAGLGPEPSAGQRREAECHHQGCCDRGGCAEARCALDEAAE